MKRAVFLAGIVLFSAVLLSAQNGAAGPGDNLVIRIAVMGPGDELYFWWGHIALIIDDTRTGQSNFYDYGLFSFENEHFFVNFAFGRLLYSCGVSPSWPNIAGYIRANRDITVYTLDLPPEKREEVRRFAENNVLPENRDYLYHHFRKNCSHPIRDIVDMAVDGQFREKYGNAPGRFTLRQHVRRHTWFSPFMDWLLNFLMGQDIDVPITVWDDLFLPSEMGKRLGEFYYTDPSGAERALVSGVEVLYRAKNRPAVLDEPREQWPFELAAGTAAALLLLFFSFVKAKRPVAGRILLGAGQSLLGLFFGGTGLVLFFMTFFTNHDYTFHNSNLLFVNPLLLAALPLGILYALGGKKKVSAGRLLVLLWRVSLAGLVLSMLIKLLPGFYQDNLTDQLLLLPIVLVSSFIPQRE
ncbi:MAG: DUF4105 domain-containing protein [Treponema sp.]|nr:DUF4105 domain-containing protein [Treponema sp.]